MDVQGRPKGQGPARAGRVSTAHGEALPGLQCSGRGTGSGPAPRACCRAEREALALLVPRSGASPRAGPGHPGLQQAGTLALTLVVLCLGHGSLSFRTQGDGRQPVISQEGVVLQDRRSHAAMPRGLGHQERPAQPSPWPRSLVWMERPTLNPAGVWPQGGHSDPLPAGSG